MYLTGRGWDSLKVPVDENIHHTLGIFGLCERLENDGHFAVFSDLGLMVSTGTCFQHPKWNVPKSCSNDSAITRQTDYISMGTMEQGLLDIP